MRAPELLAPAGTPEHMETAFAYGADAIYAGQPRYSLRVRNNSFKDAETLGAGIARAHELGKQFYLVSNIAPHNAKIRTYIDDLEPVIEHRPDALIMSDPGLIMMVRERWPEQPIHLSVQANAVNWPTVEFWRRQGLTRVILSRELGLNEIAEITEQVPGIELEVFVHGALCMAYSGRCLLSGYMNHRDANQGACTNACRWNYQVAEHTTDQSGDLIPVSATQTGSAARFAASPGAPGADQAAAEQIKAMLLEEPNRPGSFIPTYEDEHGTYIMNSRDLRAVQHVGTLCEMGIHSLKIEGRTKSTYYVARTTQAYRRAIDEAVAGQAFDMRLMDELEALSHRGYTEGFLRRHPPKEYQEYEHGSSQLGTQQVVGSIATANDHDNASDRHWLTIAVKNRFSPDDELELITPAGNLRFRATAMENTLGETMTHAPGSGHTVRIPRPEGTPESLDYSYLTKFIS